MLQEFYVQATRSSRPDPLPHEGTDVSDSEGMDRILPTNLPIDRVIADGAYYSIARGEALSDRGIVAVIPPPSHAVVHGDENTKLHDQTVQYILDKGSIYAFQKKVRLRTARAG